MNQQQRQKLAEAVEKVLDDLNLTVNAASKKLGIDRGALSRYTAGNPMTLENVERWALGFELDVNEWRVLSGYEPVRLPAGIDRLLCGLDEMGIGIYQTMRDTDSLTVEEAEAMLLGIGKALLAWHESRAHEEGQPEG